MSEKNDLNLNLLHLAFIIFLAVVFIVQFLIITPPINDYFNVNLNVVTAIILIFALSMTLLSLYNYKTLQKNIKQKTIRSEDIKVAFLQSISPITGGSLMCQMIYFHIYGQVLLIVSAGILWMILLFLKVRI